VSGAEILSLSGLALALAAAVIALWQGYLLRKQIENDRRVNEIDLYFRVANSLRDLDAFFVDRPELRPFFYENRRLPRNKREQARLSATSEMIVDLAESVIACGPGLGALAIDWHKYFAFIYRNSEALRKYWDEYSYYYPDTVREAFQAPVQARTPSYISRLQLNQQCKLSTFMRLRRKS
jgi:hypothetical protein